eukprot:CAMPEP_0116042358 /NCGR_PEP_ID=MMETSP0321-20121206/25632_1 /TAXON_ID=163516 /ORGANISM="Leptocylindrus danicus var. danicus, Strain B650" /LENGTH=612 /DNA_ID=CAMNT_0003522799 /DNA_START=166 /DNA_END=2004 /DNA_ORIENTATION=-
MNPAPAGNTNMGYSSSNKVNQPSPSSSSSYEWASNPLTVITASGRPESQAKRADDPQRQMVDAQVQQLRSAVDANLSSVEPMTYVNLGNQLIIRDRLFSGGGIDTDECVWAYDMALELLMPHKTYPQVDALICTVYSNQAEAYFMGDMFEDAAKSFTNAFNHKCNEEAGSKARYLRGSTYLILGKYKEASVDFLKVYNDDQKDIFYWRAIEKMTRILEADESVVPDGWEWFNREMTNLLPVVKQMHVDATTKKDKNDLARGVQLVHVGLFHYYDKRTTDVETAEYHLDESQKWKRSFAEYRVQDVALEKDFQYKVGSYGKSFFDSVSGMGNPSPIPIYVIGFPRSGTTLLERILDSHPSIAGLGEHSVMMNLATRARKELFGYGDKKQIIKSMSTETLNDMYERWSRQTRSLHKVSVGVNDETKPARLVDKQNMNFANIGIIHALFPNALILHVVRDPMDVNFSNYKHDFMGTASDGSGQSIDYTCEMNSLAKFYINYRKSMAYWEKKLPGRVTHIRYEDLVNDFNGVAKAVISAAGLKWSPEILDFHKKKHAVNTYSATQVRKGIYKTAMKSWKKYESHLQPLKAALGSNAQYQIETNLPGYKSPTPNDEL